MMETRFAAVCRVPKAGYCWVEAYPIEGVKERARPERMLVPQSGEWG